MMAFDVPILLCAFNRPELTALVFEAIARQKPRDLLIACDGPRADHADDRQLVADTRALVDRVDWDCNVQTLFADENFGCRDQMARAISWGFEHHEQLIILEDDCVPNDSFFDFTREMLHRYADDPQVMMVSGNTYATDGFDANSYRFSKYPLIWGWASWRRAWNKYDLAMTTWSNPATQQRVMYQYTQDPAEREYWTNIFNQQHAGAIDTWDYSWTYACWESSGVCILPKHNLVSNVGFGQQATHTFDPLSPMANQDTFPLEVDCHPEKTDYHVEADQQIRRIVFEPIPETPPQRKGFFTWLRDRSASVFSSAEETVTGSN